MRIFRISLLAVLAFIPPDRLWSAECAENRDFYQSLPTVIGREDQNTPFGFQLKCDTVFVRKGVTTVIHPGAMLYFVKPTLNSIIKVEGTLVIKGSKTSYVYLSGSLDSNMTGGRQPGGKQWGGIEVAEGGRLEMEFAGVMRAPTPITAFSPKVHIVNCFFKGSSGIILPDGNLLPLEISWHAINDLNLEKKTADRRVAVAEKQNGSGLSKEEKATLLAKKPGFWTWKRAAGGAAALAVVGVGVVFLSAEEGAGGPPVIKPADKVSTLDELPDTPK